MKQNKKREKFLENLGMIGIVIANANAFASLYILGEWILYGNKPTGLVTLPLIITAGIVEVIAARKIAQCIAKLSEPKREGVITADTICKIMKNQNTKQEAK